MIYTTPFYFLRHGEADWNLEKRCIGSINRPLTDRGRLQAEAVRARITALEIGVVFYSPLSRAADTARLATTGSQWPLIPEPDLMEAKLGVKEGEREDNPNDPFIRNWINGDNFDGAETFDEFKKRVNKALDRCFETAQDHSGLPLIVAHAGVHHAICAALDAPSIKGVPHCVPIVHHPPTHIRNTWKIVLS